MMDKLTPPIEEWKRRAQEWLDKGRAFIEAQKIALEEKKASSVAQPAAKLSFKLPKAFDLGIRTDETGRYFSGKVMEDALASLDKASLLIIGVVWLVALLACGAAYLAVKDAAALKVKTETARALEPILPKVNRLPLSKDQYEPLVTRLKKQFPVITFEVSPKPSLLIKTNDSDNFLTWLNAIGYTDSMIPSIRWTMVSFCAGPECPGDFVMQADVAAEAINIAKPEINPQ